jgi:hypothetical protein
MTAIHVHLTVEPLPSGKWAGGVRCEGHGDPYGWARPHDTREGALFFAAGELLRLVAEELKAAGVETGSAA